jgi:hypothetical protein
VPRHERQLAAVGALDDHPLRAREPAVPALQLDADAVEPSDGPRVVPIGDPVVAAAEHRGDVELARDRLGGPRDTARGAQGRGASEERLRRDARPEGAFAAHEFVFDEHDLETRGPSAIGHVLADGAGAQDDDVHFALHASPSDARRAPGSLAPA